MSRKLTYFEYDGLAEGIRYQLHYTGKKFEDVRLSSEEWEKSSGAIKKNSPFGKLPFYEEDGKILHQSIAIARYVAAGTELLPSDPWQQAVLDSIVLTIYEFLVKHIDDSYCRPEEKEALNKKFYEEDLDFYFSRFEKRLKDNNGYFIGKLSWAEFILVSLIECENLALKDNIEKNYPSIKQLVKDIPSLPGVRDYVANRKPYMALISIWQISRVRRSGKVLHQSIAIARYVVAGTELLPSDPWKQAVLDATVLNIYDFLVKHIFSRYSNPDKQNILDTKFYEEDLDFYFSRFEKQLEENNGYFCTELSWAEFLLVSLIKFANLELKDNIEKNYPLIKKLVNEIPTLTGVRNYVAE